MARLVPTEDPAALERRSDEAWARLWRLGEEIDASAAERDAAIWRDLERLSEAVSAAWPAGVSAVDAIREQRREL